MTLISAEASKLSVLLLLLASAMSMGTDFVLENFLKPQFPSLKGEDPPAQCAGDFRALLLR